MPDPDKSASQGTTDHGNPDNSTFPGTTDHGDPDRRSVLLIVGLLLLVGLVLRLAYLLQYVADIPFAHAVIADSNYYDLWARRLVAGEGFGPRPYYMAPLYPHLLAGLYSVAGAKLALVPWFQGLLGLGNLYLTYLLGRRLFGHAAGLVAGVLVTLYAPILFLESKVLTETVTITLVLASLLALERALERPSWVRFAGVGLLMGLGALARPNNLLAAGLIGLALGAGWLARLRSQGGTGGIPEAGTVRFGHLLVLGLALVVTIAPVTIRNLVVGGDSALITTNGGIVFAQGNHPDSTGIATVLPGFTTRVEDQQEEEIARAGRALGRQVSASEASSYWFRQGLAFIREQPAAFLDLAGRRLLWSLHSREARDVYNLYDETRQIPMLGLLALPFPLIAGLGLFGALATRRRWTMPRIAAGLFVLSVLATLVLFAVSFRYRAPMVPVLAAFAGFGAVRLVKAFRSRVWKSVAIAAACIIPVCAVSLVPYPITRITAESPSNTGAAFLAKGQIRQAINFSHEALDMNRNHAPAWYNLGLALHRTGDLEGALSAFREVVRIQPDNALARHNLATFLDELGRTEDAVAAYRQALDLRPDMGRTHYNLSLALYGLKDYTGARHHVQEATRLGIEPDPRFLRALQKQGPDTTRD
jgi:tetratricopeptide (TPR) repeat protein